MTKIILLLFFLSFSGLALGQSTSTNRPTPGTANASEAGKKLGISSASRRSSMPGPGNSTLKKEGDGSTKSMQGNAQGNGPTHLNHPDGRIPKSRPVGPITRPGAAPNVQPGTLPGNRPTGPRGRPGGG